MAVSNYRREFHRHETIGQRWEHVASSNVRKTHGLEVSNWWATHPIPKYGAHLGLMQSCKPNAIVSILHMKHKGLLIYHWVYHIKKQSTTGVASPYQYSLLIPTCFEDFWGVSNPLIPCQESDSDDSPPTRIPRHLCWCFPGSPVPAAEVSYRRTTRSSICPCDLDAPQCFGIEENATWTQWLSKRETRFFPHLC